MSIKPPAYGSTPTGWSETMRRWLSECGCAEPAVRWMAVIENGQGTSHVSLSEIAAVRVEDLSQVLEHRIAREVGGTSHVVRFVGGGELRYAHDHRGQVFELSATGVRGVVSLLGEPRAAAPRQVLTFGVPLQARSAP